MDNKRKRIAILGSTGSIGTQTLDVISQHPDKFEVALLTANNQADVLASQSIKFGAHNAVICNEGKYQELKSLLSGSSVTAHSGMDAVCSLVGGDDIDVVVTAMVGFSGLRSTVAAIKAGKTIALANKETLVAAGGVVTSLAKEHGVSILPVDSEHSAIFQCLQGNKDEKLAKIHLTASGGPFRTLERSEIAAAKASAALKHPNWDMGAKVTIDSATMMNKGLEVIEAKWLFGVDVKDINVLVHPQSIVHSMVEYIDGSVIAQLGCPDMREPIQYALSYPHRLNLNNKKPDFASIGKLEFFSPDTVKFPCLQLAFDAISLGGTAPVAMNAANEVAVRAYLKDEIGFYDIAETISETMTKATFVQDPSIDDIFESNSESLKIAEDLLK